MVKGTPGVTAFVGAGAKPSPLSPGEVERILHASGGVAGTAPAPKAQVEFSLGESVKVTSGPLSRLRRRDRRRQRRPAEAEGARRHLRAPGSGRARVRPGQEDRLADPLRGSASRTQTPGKADTARDKTGGGASSPACTHAHGQEGPHTHQAADPGRAGEPCAAGRPRAGPARRQHRRVHEGVQRADRARERPDHPGRDHRLRGSLLHVHHQDAAGRRPHQGGARASSRARPSRTATRSAS